MVVSHIPMTWRDEPSVREYFKILEVLYLPLIADFYYLLTTDCVWLADERHGVGATKVAHLAVSHNSSISVLSFPFFSSSSLFFLYGAPVFLPPTPPILHSTASSAI